jgi:hypothetical protein
MEQLIELLQQIQDLAGAGIDALKGATEGGGEGAPEEGAPPAEGAPPEEGAPPA